MSTSTEYVYVQLTDEARWQTTVLSRSAERTHRETAAELATFTGTMRDLAERRLTVVIHGPRRTHRGVLDGVGVDHVLVRSPSGETALLANRAIHAVGTDPGDRVAVASGAREPDHDQTFVEALGRLAEEGADVVVGLEGSARTLSGRVVALGVDVLTLAGEGAPLFVPVEAIVEVLRLPRS